MADEPGIDSGISKVLDSTETTERKARVMSTRVHAITIVFLGVLAALSAATRLGVLGGMFAFVVAIIAASEIKKFIQRRRARSQTSR